MYEAHVEHKGRGKNTTEHLVFDGRDANMNNEVTVVAFSGHDHRDDPTDCMKYLGKFMNKKREMVEITMGDDCYWWAVIEPKAQSTKTVVRAKRKK